MRWSMTADLPTDGGSLGGAEAYPLLRWKVTSSARYLAYKLACMCMHTSMCMSICTSMYLECDAAGKAPCEAYVRRRVSRERSDMRILQCACAD